MTPVDVKKQAAAEAAVALVESGMVVGLGTGSTAAFAIDALIRRAEDGLRITCIPTSERSAEQARNGGLTVWEEPSAAGQIDITIDGADEIVAGTLNVIKGLGGALLREKIVAAASRRLVIIADDGKLVERLGQQTPVPVEVVRFGWQSTQGRIEALGGVPVRRIGASGAPYVTDGGNYILDCMFREIADMERLERDLSAIVGVIDSGLFIGMATDVILGTGGQGSVRTLTRLA
ncbi:MAG: ribose-5-phosphate isomerase RpiA [Acetobacteraceae bacterium]